MTEYSLLSDKAILRHIEKGTVVVHPFVRDNLSTSSYDVTLGPFFFRENVPEPGQGIAFTDTNKLVAHYILQEFTTHIVSQWCTRYFTASSRVVIQVS